jgi:predicted Zn-dependent protease
MSNSRLEKLVEMLEKQPNDTFLLYAIAMEHLSVNDKNQAEKLLRAVLVLEKDNIPTHYQLGLMMQNKGNIREAIQLLEEGIKLAKLKGDLKTSNEFRTALDEMLFE